jgi:nucleotide-binding universal stress UspA family protein
MDASAAGPTAPILAAFAPSKSERAPIEFGAAASRITGAPLVVVHVHGDEGQAVEDLRTDLAARGIDARVETIQERTVGHGLLKAIDQFKPQLVVLGSSTRGKVGHVLLGSTAERVIHDASCPVAVVPHGYERPEGGVRLIGAAFSQSPEGREALEAAALMARRGGVRLRAITVLEGDMEQHGGMMAEQHHDVDAREAAQTRKRMGAEAALNTAVSELAGDLDTDVDVLAQDPADALIAASRHVDLLVMGSRAHGSKRSVVLGSVSRAVITGAACPVLVLPRGASEMANQLAASVQAPDAE